jgi:hypothetical protein
MTACKAFFCPDNPRPIFKADSSTVWSAGYGCAPAAIAQKMDLQSRLESSNLHLGRDAVALRRMGEDYVSMVRMREHPNAFRIGQTDNFEIDLKLEKIKR